MQSFIKENQVVVRYLFFGILTTLINILSYFFLTKALGLDYKTATTLAWIVAVAFAFITNKRYVFNSPTLRPLVVIKELGSFVLFRLASYGLDIATMILFIEVLHLNDVGSKLIANALVIVFNYLASKWFIFRARNQTQEDIQES